VSEALSQVLPRLLTDLMAPPAAASSSKDAEKAVEHHMSDKAACVKQIGLILDFALKFDGIKMMKSQIQNDFSYYRRSMGKRDFSELCVSSEDANFISLFLAASSPMVEMLKKCVKTASDQNEGVLLVLAAFANICCSMVANNVRKRVFFESFISHLFILKSNSLFICVLIDVLMCMCVYVFGYSRLSCRWTRKGSACALPPARLLFSIWSTPMAAHSARNHPSMYISFPKSLPNCIQIFTEFTFVMCWFRSSAAVRF
jgi:hypothetical protein